ncbi:helix-turn-helix domain-containing protein [Isoptericola sp. NPDC056134]|uniref:helix-turn-helix domain-containing protein n=1 Tax=Isoptericola sp. NPDC056134 TaxID=3345723 RepID=UPI0035E5082D
MADPSTTTSSTAPRLASIRDAAEHLGVSTATVRNWLGKGYFRGFKVPARRGIHVDLNEVLDARQTTPGMQSTPYGRYGENARIVDLGEATR